MIAFLWAFLILIFCIVGRVLFGTFIVDPLTLVVPGYVVTYVIYGILPDRARRGLLGKLWILTFPLTIALLWIGGVMPYWNMVRSSEVYFGLLPQSFVGPLDGNEFMWNGLGLTHVFGNVVPAVLTPTYHYFWFNVLAVLIWLSYPLLLGWAVLVANYTVLSRPNFLQWVRRLLFVFAVGLGFTTLNAALAALISAYYLHY